MRSIYFATNEEDGLFVEVFETGDKFCFKYRDLDANRDIVTVYYADRDRAVTEAKNLISGKDFTGASYVIYH
jgi:hypothetical protein